MAETPILSLYPTNHSLHIGLMLLDNEFIAKNYQLSRKNIASHKKVL
jgi:hypothetical protein